MRKVCKAEGMLCMPVPVLGKDFTAALCQSNSFEMHLPKVCLALCRVHSVPCAQCAVCTVVRVHSEQCAQYAVCTVCSVHSVPCAQCAVCTVFRVHRVPCAQCAQ